MPCKTSVYLLWNKRLHYGWMSFSRENGRNILYGFQVLHYCDRPSESTPASEREEVEREAILKKLRALHNIKANEEKIVSAAIRVIPVHANASMKYSMSSPEKIWPSVSGNAQVVRSYTQQSAPASQSYNAIISGGNIGKTVNTWIPRQTTLPDIFQKIEDEKLKKEKEQKTSEISNSTIDKQKTVVMKSTYTKCEALDKSEVFNPIAWLPVSSQENIKTSDVITLNVFNRKKVDFEKHLKVPHQVLEKHEEKQKIQTKGKERNMDKRSIQHRVKKDLVPDVYKDISFIHGVKNAKAFSDVIKNLLQLEFSYHEILEMDSEVLKWLIDQRLKPSSISRIVKMMETKQVQGSLLSKENSPLFFTQANEMKKIYQHQCVLRTLKSLLHIKPDEMKNLRQFKHNNLHNAVANVYLLHRWGYTNDDIKTCFRILIHSTDKLKAGHSKMISDVRLSSYIEGNSIRSINILNYTIELFMNEDGEKS